MSKNNIERFDFDVMQNKEKDRITELIEELKNTTNTKRKIDPAKIKLKRILHDGYVGKKDEFKGILIIAAEAHDSRGINDEINSYNGFYVQEVVQTGDIIYKGNGRRFMNNINRIYKSVSNYINNNENDVDFVSDNKKANITDYSRLKEIAYINLKKIGGASSLDAPATRREDGCDFYEWVKTYKEFLIKQINDIKPNYIVLCGWPVQNAYNELLANKIDGNVVLYNSRHPSARCKIKEFVESVKPQQ